MMLPRRLILTLIGLAELVEQVDHVILDDHMLQFASGEKGTAFTLLTNKDVQFATLLVRNLVRFHNSKLTNQMAAINRNRPIKMYLMT